MNIPPAQFVQDIQRRNTHTTDVTWNDEKPTKQQLDENFQSINEFDSASVHNGYHCSTFDPFIFIVCQLYQCDIIHDFYGNQLAYKNVVVSHKTIRLVSDQSHMSFHSVHDK